MHHLIKKPKEVERIAKNKEDENWAFRNYLKEKSSKQVDKVVWQLNDEITKQIDCTECGNCCKNINAAFDTDEVGRVAPELNLSVHEFTQQYCHHDEFENIYFIKKPPCVFLKENKCTVYEKRPASCAEFPHLNKPNFIFRTMGVLENYKICPIVYNVVEQLKAHYHFHY